MVQKGRPRKVRFIQNMPGVRLFSPRGKPGRPEEVVLHVDEFEALKLSDHQMFSQSEGALAMKLSRASFGRSVRGARKKIADALVNGKIIKIEMGHAQIGVRQKEITRDNLLTYSQKKSSRAADKMIVREISAMVDAIPSGMSQGALPRKSSLRR